MPPSALPRDQYEALIGKELARSDWIPITQEMIDGFCEITGDFQFIHNDPDRAKSDTPFGGAIAHGFLTLSLVTQMYKDNAPPLEGHPLVINYGMNKVRFLSPVPSGARVRGTVTLTSVTDKGAGRVLTENAITVELEGADRPAMLCDWLTLLVADNS